MKKLCLLFFAVALCLSSYAQYVDLGLPSGTLWKEKNEVNDDDNLFSYEEAMSKFSNSLPTKEQMQELRKLCNWTWIGNGYKVTGPNGNSIVLQADGYRDCYGSIYFVGLWGSYCSLTKEDSWIWKLSFDDMKNINVKRNSSCGGLSVRLVQK